MLGRDVHVRIGAFETHQEPFLLLSSISAFPKLTDQVERQIIRHPILGFSLNSNKISGNSRFFPKLAQSSFARRFTLVDSALRHLPCRPRVIDALTYKNIAVLIDKHHANTGPIGKGCDVIGRHSVVFRFQE